MHDKVMLQLSSYADGELKSSEREIVERHLAECAECRGALEGIGGVKAWAPTYQGVAPSRDLWRNIESRLGTRPIGSGAMKPAWHGRRISVRIPLLAAAAVVLLALGAAATRLFLSNQVVTDSVPFIQARHGWDSAAADSTNNQYDAAIAELEQILTTNGGALEPATLDAIRESLVTIDKAINDARQAIAADSTNDYLNASIAQNMQRKLEILRTAAQAVTAKS
jgi:hypothetical protein